jgi:hypothetical protein
LLANQLLSSLTYANNFNDNFNFVYHNYFKTTLRHIDILRTPTTGNQYVSRCIQAGFAATDAPPDTLPWPIDLHPGFSVPMPRSICIARWTGPYFAPVSH